jgi:hypothetical protein
VTSSFAFGSAGGSTAGLGSSGGGGGGGAGAGAGLDGGAGGLSLCKGTPSDKKVMLVTLALALGFDLAFFAGFLAVEWVLDLDHLFGGMMSHHNHAFTWRRGYVRDMMSHLISNGDD